MVFFVLLSAVWGASPFDGVGSPIEIQFITTDDGLPDSNGQSGNGDIDPADLANILPLLDIFNNQMVKAPVGAPQFDPMLPLLAGMLAAQPDQPDVGSSSSSHGFDPLSLDNADSALDPFTSEMLQRMGIGLLTPPTPKDDCSADVKKWCPPHTEGSSSVISCLSKNAEKLDGRCYSQIKHTIPHVCSSQIDSMCDTITEGVMACLERNIGKLTGKCLNSVNTARHAADAVKDSKQVDFKNKLSGEVKPLFRSMDELEASFLSAIKRQGLTLPFAVILVTGAVLCMALYWYVREITPLNRRLARMTGGKCADELKCRDAAMESGYGSIAI